ncbi:MAG: thioredoxin family protein [Burkholderiales bacterium]
MTTSHSPARRRALLALSLAMAAPLARTAGGSGAVSQPPRYGAAPEFAGIGTWLNSEPLSIAALRGQVVMVNFWTYGCINCVHVLPHVVQWHETYKDRGLVVVGVHTPEFAHERDTGNVKKAIQRHGIRYAVAQDNKFATWNAYRNRYWPASYLVNRSGEVVFEHAGEGAYGEIERTIQRLLG